MTLFKTSWFFCFYTENSTFKKLIKLTYPNNSFTVFTPIRRNSESHKTVLDDVIIGDYAEFHTEETHDDLFGGYSVTIDKFISNRVLSKIDEFNQKALLNSSPKKPYKQIVISEDGLELIEFLSLDCTAAEGEWHSDSEIKIDKNGFVIINGAKTKDFWDSSIRSEKNRFA